jgi:hypothetical protein
MIALLLTLIAASCATAPRPQVILPVEARQPADVFMCPTWPVLALLEAQTATEQLTVVHRDAEPAHADCACRLYAQGLALQRRGLLMGELGPPPYGCSLALADSEDTH